MNNIENLYDNVNGFELSHKWRGENLSPEQVGFFMYGESNFECIKKILSCDLIDNKVEQGANFIDIGSGIGNVAISASILLNFQSITGVEMMDDLYNKSVEIHQKFKEIKPELANKINLIHANALDIDFSKYDILYANHPIHTDCELHDKLYKKFNECKSGSIFIGVISGIEDANWEFQFSNPYEFSWGEGTVKYYVKK